MEKISWTDSVRNEVLHGVREETNILLTIKRRKGHILCRNCLLKHVVKGKDIEKHISDGETRLIT